MNPKDLARAFTPPDFSQAVHGLQQAQIDAAVRKRKVEESTNFLGEFQRASLASKFAANLRAAILHFEASLDADHEVGMRLVSFGQTITFHVEDVRYHNPSLIFFRGVSSEGHRVELIQHTTQISFLLMALPKADPLQPRRKFGFGPPDPAPSEDPTDAVPPVEKKKRADRKSEK